jgi:hypothetical protein
VARNDDQVRDGQLPGVVIEQKEIRVGIAAESLDHGSVCAIDYLGAKPSSLAFQLIVFLADGTEKVGTRIVVAVPRNVTTSTVRTVHLTADPMLAQYSDPL